MDSKCATALVGLAALLNAEGFFEESAARYSEALAVDREDTQAIVGSAETLLELHEFERARVVLDGVPDKERRQSNVVLAHVHILTRLRRFDEASESLASITTDHLPNNSFLRIAEDIQIGFERIGIAAARGDYSAAIIAARSCRSILSEPALVEHLQAMTSFCEHMADAKRKLEDRLTGRTVTATPEETAGMADVAYTLGRYVVSARLFREAFAADPEIASDPSRNARYEAAAAAIHSAAGAGPDAADLDAETKSKWRREALAWLRAELDVRISHLKDDKIPRPEVRTELRELLRDRDFNSVRQPESMTELGDEEFGAWSRFWMRVTEAFEESLR